MRELIYKDEAYKAIDNCVCDSCYRISPADAKMNIRHLVSDANEVDKLQGEWIPNSPFTGNCSECGADGNLKDNYCSNCGARMFAKDINVPNKKGADDGRVFNQTE